MTTNNQTGRVIALATLAVAASETKTREDGTAFVTFNHDTGPAWLQTVCMTAHGSMMPDDERYKMIDAAFRAISDADEANDLDDLAHTFADETPSLFDYQRAQWLASNVARGAYVNDAVSEIGAAQPFKVSDAIAMGWMYEAREVFDYILSDLREIAEAQEQAEEEAEEADANE